MYVVLILTIEYRNVALWTTVLYIIMVKGTRCAP